jgi:hypothetical protein
MENRPRVVFLIPIASARAVADWHLGCSYLRQTLASIFNSSNGDFRVVVAGHETPDFELPKDPRFKFISLPHTNHSEAFNTYADKQRDKMAKLSAAWNYAKATWNPQYVMKIDWDDFISSKLVDWLSTAKDESGYCIKDGWFWESGSRLLIQQTEKFDERCGSCLIIRHDLADLQGPFLTLQGEGGHRIIDHRSLVPGAETSSLLLNDCHNRAEAQFGYLGHQLAIVPFRAAIYRIRSTISMSQTGMVTKIHSLRWLLGRIRRTRLITPSLRREFCLGFDRILITHHTRNNRG